MSDQGMHGYYLQGMRVTKEEYEDVMAMSPSDREKYLGVTRCHACGQTVVPLSPDRDIAFGEMIDRMRDLDAGPSS